jgi:histidine triad (HIT) family protein
VCGGVEMAKCIFCEIISRNIPSSIVYEDEKVIAIDDINPQAPVHVLIIPKKHIPTIVDLRENEDELMGYLVKVARDIAIKKGIAERGFRLIFNCNSESGQTIYHIHLHLIGGRVMGWPPG